MNPSFLNYRERHGVKRRKWMKSAMEISSIENSHLHIQIKNLNICTTHSKTHGKSRDFFIARIHLFQCEASPPCGSLGAGGHLDSNI